jgi:hypothetical protein
MRTSYPLPAHAPCRQRPATRDSKTTAYGRVAAIVKLLEVSRMPRVEEREPPVRAGLALRLAMHIGVAWRSVQPL